MADSLAFSYLIFFKIKVVRKQCVSSQSRRYIQLSQLPIASCWRGIFTGGDMSLWTIILAELKYDHTIKFFWYHRLKQVHRCRCSFVLLASYPVLICSLYTYVGSISLEKNLTIHFLHGNITHQVTLEVKKDAVTKKSTCIHTYVKNPNTYTIRTCGKLLFKCRNRVLEVV